MTTTDRFRIASISKVVTAPVVLQLVDAGFLQLDEPVGQRLAGLVGVAPGNGVAAVTVRQLLSHTSGFPDYRGSSSATGSAPASGRGVRPRPIAGPAARDRARLQQPQLLPARAAHRRRHRTSYEVATNQLLLQPLGISGMRLVATVDPNPDEVVHVSGAQRTYMQSLGGAGAWVATPADMVRILDSLDPATPWLASAAARDLDDDASSARRHLPRAAGTALRARHRRLARRIVGAHRHGREHAHDARPPARRRDVVHPRQRRRPRVHRGLREVFDRALGQSGIALSPVRRSGI